MRKALLTAVALVVCVGCVTSLTAGGQTVRLVTQSQEKPCEMVTVVALRASNGYGRTQKTANAITQARNKAARLGGNAIRVVDVEASPASTSLTFNVLKCDFLRKPQ